MLALFLVSGHSVSIDEGNYRNISLDNGGKPLVLELWDPFCGHCKEFRTTWVDFIEHSKFQTDVIFGDVNCLAQKKFCRSLSVSAFPTVVFYDIVRNISIVFEGAMNMAGMESFIEKQINFPIKIITSDDELESAKSITNISSLFYLEFDDSRNDLLEIVKKTAESVRFDDCVFVARRAGQTSLRAFKSATFSVDYDGDWSDESLSEFVNAHLYCLLAPLTSRVLDSTTLLNKQLFIVFFREHMYTQIAEDIKGIKFPYPVFYEVYGKAAVLARIMKVQASKLPQYVLADPNKTRFFTVPVNESTALQDWMNQLDLSKIKWEGEPGWLDLLGPIGEMGSWPIYVIAACFVVVICTFIWVGFDSYRMYRMESQARKKE
jgi:protein disulfide-isomerase